VLYTVLKPCTLALAKLLFRLEGRGIEHVPATGAVLLAANHSSVLDPPLVGAVAPRQLSFMAKADLFRIPLFGALIRRLHATPLRREGSDPGALRTALRMLEEGRALLIFPEGTRGEEGTLRPAKAGVGMLAVMAGVPVVPVFVRGSGAVWPRGRRLPRPGKVIVTFGPALTFERRAGADRKQQYEAASRTMMDAIGRLRAASTGQTSAGFGSGDNEFEVVGRAGGRARHAPKYNDGRNGQDG
jgi:1-acyl-sn-glycerol-3-phosphate acyltransferase